MKMNVRKLTGVLGLLAAVLLMTGCVAGGGKRITNFTDRSVGYGWLDITEVDANKLNSVEIYQYVPKTDKPYWNVKVKEFMGGWLYYSFAFANGSYGTHSAGGQKCFGLCGNTVYTYNFGRQSDGLAKARMKKPGVYYFGAYRLEEVKTGFFEQGKFDIIEAHNAPTKKQMLEEILKDAEDKPVVAQRIRAEMKRYGK